MSWKRAIKLHLNFTRSVFGNWRRFWRCRFRRWRGTKKSGGHWKKCEVQSHLTAVNENINPCKTRYWSAGRIFFPTFWRNTCCVKCFIDKSASCDAPQSRPNLEKAIMKVSNSRFLRRWTHIPYPPIIAALTPAQIPAKVSMAGISFLEAITVIPICRRKKTLHWNKHEKHVFSVNRKSFCRCDFRQGKRCNTLQIIKLACNYSKVNLQLLNKCHSIWFLAAAIAQLYKCWGLFFLFFLLLLLLLFFLLGQCSKKVIRRCFWTLCHKINYVHH